MKICNMWSKTRIILASILLAVLILSIIGVMHTRDTYTYSIEELESIFNLYSLRANDVYHIPQEILTTSINSNDFISFSTGKTLREDLYKAIGTPHASCGSGLIADVYFTSDRYLIFVYYQYGKISESIRVDLKTNAKEWNFIKQTG